MRGCLLVLLVVCTTFFVWRWDRAPERQTARLRPVLALLTELKVKVYRNQDWCKCFQYGRGSFVETSHESTCSLFRDKAKPFDEQSRQDLEKIRAALHKSRVEVVWICQQLSDEKVPQFEFALSGGGFYVYQPGFSLPRDQGSEVRHTRIDSDFYLRLEDWN